jgi:hypothetical protein
MAANGGPVPPGERAFVMMFLAALTVVVLVALDRLCKRRANLVLAQPCASRSAHGILHGLFSGPKPRRNTSDTRFSFLGWHGTLFGIFGAVGWLLASAGLRA